MADREYLVPKSTPVRAVRAVWDPDRPNSQIRIETATRISIDDIDRRQVTVLPRELKWIYEQTIGRRPKSEAEVPQAVAPSSSPKPQTTQAPKPAPKRPGPKPASEKTAGGKPTPPQDSTGSA